MAAEEGGQDTEEVGAVLLRAEGLQATHPRQRARRRKPQTSSQYCWTPCGFGCVSDWTWCLLWNTLLLEHRNQNTPTRLCFTRQWRLAVVGGVSQAVDPVQKDEISLDGGAVTAVEADGGDKTIIVSRTARSATIRRFAF